MPTHLVISKGTELLRVPLNSLMYISADGNYSIVVTKDSHKTLMSIQLGQIFILGYFIAIGVYLSTRRNYRRKEEHGSAKWGDASSIDKKYRQKPQSNNKLMTQNVRIGINAQKHRRNLNTLVCGGSGAGKTRFS